MSDNNSKKDKKKKAESKFYKGLTFKEFKGVGRIALNMNDVAWAGRLYTKYPFWFKRLTILIWLLCAVSVVCLALIWGSILMRPPALLLGVYPQGQVVCFPRLFNGRAEKVQLDEDYIGVCKTLDRRAGMAWQTENSETISNQEAIGDVNMETSYESIEQAYNNLENSRQQGLSGPSLADDLQQTGGGL